MNINKDDSSIELHENELKGLGPKDLAKMKKVPNKPGYYLVSLKKQFISHITKKLELEETRKKINFAEG